MDGLWAGRFLRGVHRSRGGRGRCLGVGARVPHGPPVGVFIHGCAPEAGCRGSLGIPATVSCRPIQTPVSPLVTSRISSGPAPRPCCSVSDLSSHLSISATNVTASSSAHRASGPPQLLPSAVSWGPAPVFSVWSHRFGLVSGVGGACLCLRVGYRVNWFLGVQPAVPVTACILSAVGASVSPAVVAWKQDRKWKIDQVGRVANLPGHGCLELQWGGGGCS